MGAVFRSHTSTWAGSTADCTARTSPYLTTLQIHVVANPVGEGGDRGLGAVSGPVEALINQPLHPSAQRGEQRVGSQG